MYEVESDYDQVFTCWVLSPNKCGICFDFCKINIYPWLLRTVNSVARKQKIRIHHSSAYSRPSVTAPIAQCTSSRNPSSLKSACPQARHSRGWLTCRMGLGVGQKASQIKHTQLIEKGLGIIYPQSQKDQVQVFGFFRNTVGKQFLDLEEIWQKVGWSCVGQTMGICFAGGQG